MHPAAQSTSGAGAGLASEASAAHRLQVEVIYNGMRADLHYDPHELGRVLFEQACHAFGIPTGERDQLGLYLPDNSTEVRSDIPVAQSGVTPAARLILRPRRASGG